MALTKQQLMDMEPEAAFEMDTATLDLALKELQIKPGTSWKMNI